MVLAEPDQVLDDFYTLELIPFLMTRKRFQNYIKTVIAIFD